MTPEQIEQDQRKADLDKILDARRGEEEDEGLIVRKCLQLWRSSLLESESERKVWEKQLNIYNDRHWVGVNWSEERSQVTVNLTKSFVESTVAALTDNRPNIFILPRNPIDSKLGADLEFAVQSVLDVEDFDMKLPRTVRTNVAIGNSFQKVIWNPHVNKGGQKGQIELHGVLPFALFPDPEAMDFDAARYVCHLQDLPYDWLLENYPELADKIPAGEWDLELHSAKYLKAEYDGVIPMAGTKGTAWLMPFERTSGERMRGMGQRARLMEVFIRETANVIRRILLANGHVLENEYFGVPDPHVGCINFRNFPFVHYFYVPVEWSFWASGLISGLEGLQLELNKVRSLILDHMIWNINAPWIVDNEAGPDFKIDNAPNSIMRKPKDAQIRREPPQPLPNAVLQLPEIIRFEMEMLTGHVEILQGRRPTGIEAAQALQILQEQANMRVRQHARYLEDSIEKLGELIIDFIAAYWTESRLVRMFGPSGQMVNRYMSGLQFRGHEFDVDVKAGSTLPFSRHQLMQEAIQIYQLGGFGQPGSPGAVQEVLKAREWPGWVDIVRRLTDEQAQAQLSQEETQQVPTEQTKTTQEGL